MTLKTDDCDIRDVRFYMDFGGNGDYYINLMQFREDEEEVFKWVNMRFAMSGGNAPTEVKLAIANLYRAMEAAGLNKPPREDNS